MKHISVLLAAAALTLTVSVGAASASAPPTPKGFVGACNMLNDQTMWTVAMFHSNINGSNGMWGAVDASGCS